MNDITKNLLGKTVLLMCDKRGQIIAFDDATDCYIVRLEPGFTGWRPTSRILSVIKDQSPHVAPYCSGNVLWWAKSSAIVGVLTPVSDLAPTEVIHSPVIPAKPVEPSAPMTSQVLQMLRTKGDVTTIEAIGVLRCRSLSKRISELRQLGHKITRSLHNDHTGQRYARYALGS